MAQPGRARAALGPALIGVGGALAVLGSTLTWIRYSFAQPALAILSQSRPGVAGGAGRVTLACGAVALAAVPVMLVGNARWRRGMAALAVVLGLSAAVVAAVNLATKDAQVYDSIRAGISQTTGHELSDAEFARLKAQLLATGFVVSLGPGLYVVLAGGLLAVAGGLAELADGQEPTEPDSLLGDEDAPPAVVPDELASPPDTSASQPGSPNPPI